MNRRLKLVFACGGTGGHITPALAMADTVKENDPHAEILFVGSAGGMENAMVSGRGYPIKALRVEGLRRRLTPKNIGVLWHACRAVGEARALLRELAPDLVIGTGGYACYPALQAAIGLKIPTALHESNAAPGLAVKRLAGRVDRVWLNFPEAAADLPKSAPVRVVGNPLPRGRGESTVSPKDDRLTVLSFGGSLGAAAINRAMLSLMEREQHLPHVFHVHATGKGEYDAFIEAFRSKGLDRCPRFSVKPFIEDMPRQMAAATLTVTRSGAMTLSELAAAGVAALLIPSPNVTGDHQYKNAKVLADAKAALLLSEAELPILPDLVLSLLKDAPRRLALSQGIKAFARPEANRLIYEDILHLTSRKRK